ncbi:metalloregulator ArsR/SmtB family transcription factor, partial [Tepidibacillus decaturensis]
MQLDRLVNFHKVLADPTRIRILVLLAKEPLHGQALAGKLGVKPPTITHHMMKLREVGLIYERRDKNTIYFYLDEKTLRRKAESIIKVVFSHELSDQLGGEDMEEETEREKMKKEKLEKQKVEVIKNFFTPNGKLKNIPSQRKKKLFVLEYMIKELEQGKKYSEKEINEHIKQFHEDFATIRREFIVNSF